MVLNDICNVITCGVAKRPEYVDDGVPFLSSKNVKSDRFLLNEYKYVSQEDFLSLTKNNKPEVDDILYTRVGSFGEAAVINFDFDFAIFVSLTLIKPKKDIVLPRYLMHYLNSPKIKHLADNSTSGVGVQNLNVKVVREFPIKLPPLATQQKIAEILDEADKLRQLNKELIAKYDALTQSLFLDMFGGYFKDKSYYVSINELTSFIDYRGKTLAKVKDGIPYITAKSVRVGYFDKSRLDFISKESYSAIMTRGYPKIGDVLFTTEGATMGFTCRIPSGFKEFSVGQRLITLQTNENYNSTVLEFMLNSLEIQKRIFKLATGSAVKGIRAAKFKTIQIPVPPIQLQNQFAERIALIEQQKQQAQEALQKSENLFNSLLQKAFKGELVN